MRAFVWALGHTARGHIVLPGRSPAIPTAPVWRCHRCGLIRQAV